MERFYSNVKEASLLAEFILYGLKKCLFKNLAKFLSLRTGVLIDICGNVNPAISSVYTIFLFSGTTVH